MHEHYGLWSLLPPLLAIVLAMVTRRVVLSLLVGVFSGALILAGGNPPHAIVDTWATYLWPALINGDHLRVFAFTSLMGAMVGVIHRNGGMRGLVMAIRPLATTRRRGQMTSWLLGLVVFFDDYANSLLLGSTLRPVTDRLRISREKLAYIVDSTAAPIAGIAILSTWVASEVGFIEEGLDKLDVGASSSDAFRVFVETIVYRFYPLLALAFVGLVALTGRDFGPMLAAERRALSHSDGDGSGSDESERTGSPWYMAVVPVAAVLIVLVLLLYVTGRNSAASDAGLWQIFGNSDSYSSLMYAALVGFLAAVALTCWCGNLPTMEIWQAAMAGVRLMLPALAILWMAWSLSDVVGKTESVDYPRLGTAVYLGSLIEGTITPPWMPTIVFLLSSIVAFCTGTSWGTMTILTPLVIKTTWQVTGGDSLADIYDPIMLGSIGSVLAGAIFGDHCSPISDTTVLSSRACLCDHISHVWTQMPYALIVAVFSVLLGTIPLGFGVSVWVLLPTAGIALLVWLLLVGRPAQEHGDGE